jgi:hypothetical protein
MKSARAGQTPVSSSLTPFDMAMCCLPISIFLSIVALV